MFHSVHGDWPPPQVGVYYRWYRWLTEVALQGKKFILVNMDETGVGVSETTKRGWYTTERLELRSDTQRVTKQLNTDYTHMKTSLLGVICCSNRWSTALYSSRRTPPPRSGRVSADTSLPLFG